MDFGELGAVKAWLEQHFDHTLLLDTDDPLLPKFRELEGKPVLAGLSSLMTWVWRAPASSLQIGLTNGLNSLAAGLAALC